MKLKMFTALALAVVSLSGYAQGHQPQGIMAVKPAAQNIQGQYSAPPAMQKAQSAKKRTVKGYGITVVISGDWVTVDGKPAALDENNATAKSYSQGLYNIVVYKSGKVALLKQGEGFVGYLK
ncbi:hypothetical protein ACCW92_00370 [Enterobacter soli]|uniref:hypothetical protein n=1 Tax=Enterobacter soli TaxID=885040 RepID=UPI0028650B93|nr:hypothetical protein [Enterobacter soli]